MQFANPYFLLLLAVIPVLVFIELKKGGLRRGSFLYSSTRLFEGLPVTGKMRLAWVPYILKVLSLILIVFALARPQGGRGEEEVFSEGIDIMLVLDISGSMKSEDFTPKNRLHVAKEVMARFIDNRKTDRLGLVVFASGGITQCPLTVDHMALKKLLSTAQIGMIEDGTAIGVAVATGVNRLKDSQGKSRVMVLLTDGVNNRGEIDPITAAELARTFGIKVYTIGVGKQGTAPYPVGEGPFGKRYVQVRVEIDEDVLREIASTTGGRYYRATNPEALMRIYEEIDSMEKTIVKTRSRMIYTERYLSFVVPAVLLLSLGTVVTGSVFRRLP
jgi:Ca-activated chloride channel family protein